MTLSSAVVDLNSRSSSVTAGAGRLTSPLKLGLISHMVALALPGVSSLRQRFKELSTCVEFVVPVQVFGEDRPMSHPFGHSRRLLLSTQAWPTPF